MIQSLNKMILNDIENLLRKFNIDSYESKDRICLKCPIHNGDKRDACTIYKDSGKWFCWTHNCHQQYQSNLFAFFSAILRLDNKQTINWFLKYFNTDIKDIIIDDSLNVFNKISNIISKENNKVGISREQIKSLLNIPSKYFLNRGFKQETLLKYDVGDCFKPNKQMYKRAVVPIYDINHELMVGCVGRRLTEDEKYPKWINSSNFKRSENLYNIWYAKEEITKTGTIVICEGQGDVWRLSEAGINNAVGIFGTSLTDNQLFILESLPIFNMIVLTDNDSAGKEARNKIIEQCGRLYNISYCDLPGKDVGDMSIDEINKYIKPLMEKI